jgi:hypothetical protein
MPNASRRDGGLWQINDPQVFKVPGRQMGQPYIRYRTATNPQVFKLLETSNDQQPRIVNFTRIKQQLGQIGNKLQIGQLVRANHLLENPNGLAFP